MMILFLKVAILTVVKWEVCIKGWKGNCKRRQERSVHSVGVMQSAHCLKFSSASLGNGFLLRRLCLAFVSLHMTFSLFFFAFFGIRLLVSCSWMFFLMLGLVLFEIVWLFECGYCKRLICLFSCVSQDLWTSCALNFLLEWKLGQILSTKQRAKFCTHSWLSCDSGGVFWLNSEDLIYAREIHKPSSAFS